ncbi:glycosyltransferase family 2 protein [Phenylobacterium sp. J426]|uniref:glycosyltransferase family 2 protein n=1 Tax=Phenylobacterium sp. J426 TaxID=2898439 RepID=UPI002150AB77|nr:glycosyltransferase family A protein [Phenylobacterium sp. J426]MCR5872867.1 glycosyltransferase family 2 protein [Phenylobacterium sp. J426]
MGRISVGLRVESPRFLAATLRSLAAQTFPDFEIIVVDDSPDGRAGDAARRLGDPRLRVIAGERRGWGAALTRIWGQAGGEFLKIVAEGDLLRPRGLEVLHGLMRHAPQAGVAFGRRVVVDENDVVLSRPQAPIRPGPQGLAPGELPAM